MALTLLGGMAVMLLGGMTMMLLGGLMMTPVECQFDNSFWNEPAQLVGSC